MQKQIISDRPTPAATTSGSWLDLEALANVQITSEAPGHTIESALLTRGGTGWRASEPGQQLIRLLFPAAQRIKRVRLAFVETERPRTQEFVLRWRSQDAAALQDIVRQQFVFSPPGTTHEVEEYAVDLPGVVELELRILPDIGGSQACASLSELRLA